MAICSPIALDALGFVGSSSKGSMSEPASLVDPLFRKVSRYGVGIAREGAILRMKRRHVLKVSASRGSSEGDSELQQKLVELARLQIKEAELGEISSQGADRMKRLVREVLDKEEELTARRFQEFKKYTEKVLKNLEADLQKADKEIRSKERVQLEEKYLRKMMAYEMSLREKQVQDRRKDHSVWIHRSFLIVGLGIVTSVFGLSLQSAWESGGPVDLAKFIVYIVIMTILGLQLAFENEIHGLDEEDRLPSEQK